MPPFKQELVARCVAVASLLGINVVARALPPDAVDRSQRATALVEVHTSDGPASGSAFCIDKSGLFVTDGHVVLPMEGTIQLVIRSGEADQRIVPAQVVGIDYDDDIAILQVAKPGQVPVLDLGNSDKLLSTQEVTAFGYPFGNELALDKKSFPSVSVNTGKITSLRKKQGELSLIQIDALVNPGNSGGPVVDADGRVIGIVESGVPGAGLNFATPVAKLQKMMQSPLIVLYPSSIDYSDRSRQQVMTVSITWPSHPQTDYRVDLKLTDPKGHDQTLSGQSAKGSCDFQFVPMPNGENLKWNPMVDDSPPVIKFTLTIKNGERVVGTNTGEIPLDDVPMGGPGVARGGNGGARKPKKGGIDPLPADAVETEMAGGDGATPFREVNTNLPPIGVHCSLTTFQGQNVIGTINLMYSFPTARGPHMVEAREGYVVGGLLVDGDQYVNAFKVIFIHHDKDGKLDPTDTYTSGWQGTPTSAKQQRVAGAGEKVIGLCGRKAGCIYAVGLVINKPPATQPAPKN